MKYIPRNYTKEELYQEYIVNNLSRGEIAKKYNTSVTLVEYDIQKYHFQKAQEAIREVTGGRKQINKDLLYDYYILQNHSTDETAVFFNLI